MTKETDRELLELAAKAAGWSNLDWLAGDGYMNVYDARGNQSAWNPRKDNGDAFRLAIQLRMCVDTWGVGVVSAAVLLKNRVFVAEEQRGDDAEDATRHAIVRAAAEIGRAMP